MGLDQYLYIIEKEDVDELIQSIEDKDYDMIHKILKESIAYWRKDRDIAKTIKCQIMIYENLDYYIFKRGFTGETNDRVFDDLINQYYVYYESY